MRKIILIFSLLFLISNLGAQGIGDDYPVELKRVVILTSGLAYFEHTGSVSGNANIVLPFRREAMSDAIRTLVVNDSASASPVVTYQMESSFTETSQIAINTAQGMMIYPVDFIRSVRFSDPELQAQVDSVLENLTETRNSSRLLTLNLPGTGTRNITLSYVLPSPVWKVSYRLDLGQTRPVFQGWAIVDNDSDTDWNNVELSLVAGRPVSFIQNLYPPYYVARPVLPLSIAGTASAQVHDRAAGNYETEYMMMEDSAMASRSAPAPSRERAEVLFDYDTTAYLSSNFAGQSGNVTSGNLQTAQGAEAAGQFEFTLRTPVTIASKSSAMFPLVESRIEARKILFYNGQGRFPRLGAEITNNTGMKLPAGPITVYDAGIYAGDALIEFWNEGEKRIISFGEDMTVSASMNSTNTNVVSTVTISGGVMTITRNLSFITTYNFINSDSSSKIIVVEKTKTANTTLVTPEAAEQTTNAYRFNVTLPGQRAAGSGETVFTVTETRPVASSVTLLSQNYHSLLSYSTNQEIPQRVRTALQRAAELRQAVDAAALNTREIESNRNRLIAEQERIRNNLQAVGSQTTQGAEYLRRLTALDAEIDGLTRDAERARTAERTAQQTYENYINGLNL